MVSSRRVSSVKAKKVQKMTYENFFEKPILKKAPFFRMCREIVSEYPYGIRFSTDALNALLLLGEEYLSRLFTGAKQMAEHAKRVTVKPNDAYARERLCSRKYSPKRNTEL